MAITAAEFMLSERANLFQRDLREQLGRSIGLDPYHQVKWKCTAKYAREHKDVSYPVYLALSRSEICPQNLDNMRGVKFIVNFIRYDREQRIFIG